jgi:UDP-N-acetyl-D-mannosaminuronic acid dehydrogenase
LKFNKICVLGLGYIGLPTAGTLATRGVKVVGVDVNPLVINSLQNGHVHLYEPGLGELIAKALQSGNLVVSEQPEPADAFEIAVPTPFFDDKRADMTFVQSAAEAIVPYLQPGNLVLLESTSPPRTTVDLVVPILEKSGLKAGTDFFVAYSPERVLPGQILRELVENTRVVGGITPESAQAARDFYAIFVTGEIVQTDATTAEMVKLMENTYRDVNIAVANEFSRLADRFGVDVWEAISLANRHPRVKILRPGPGVGGHCISVDPWFLVEAAPDLVNVIRAARQVNDTQPSFAAHLVERALGDLSGKRITALGLAFKPDVDDLRESPAIEVVHKLLKAGAQVTVYEPYKLDFTIDGAQTAQTLEEALRGSDAIVLLVGHTQYLGLDPATVAKMTNARVVVDTVNGWQPAQWQAAGFDIYRLGVGSIDGQ